jgi:aldehyde:ferredoxin oxidoreductase
MTGGYMGKMLFVNLSSGKTEEKELTEEMARTFIGGYGIGAKVLYDMMDPGVDPLGPDNVLGFITGPATGTSAYGGSRYTLVHKSPVSGTWNDANSGGFFGPELKKAGYDAVFITGASSKPVYLWINDGKAEIRDASHLWGKDTKDTWSALMSELNDKKVRVTAIGPAGEKMALMSCPINDGHRAPARGGGGAVMGSKKLKAIAVRGSREIPVADPERIKDLNRRVRISMKSGPLSTLVTSVSEMGTGAGTADSALSGDSPVKNWGGVGLFDFGEEAAKKIASVEGDKYKSKKYACFNCPVGCGARYEVKSGRWPVGETDRPEYETAAAFGTMTLTSDIDAIIKANDICNRYGLDTISTGCTVAWAMECYEEGILSKKDLDGVELKWGNGEAVVAITEKIAKMEGCGAVLAHGSEAAARKWGKGAEFLQTVRGIELPMHDPRHAPGYARTYQFDPTPARHVKGGLGMAHAAGAPVGDKHDYKTTGFLDVVLTTNQEVQNCAGFCLFVGVAFPDGAQNDYIEAITGWTFKSQHSLITGLRILNMRHAFNIREGLKPADFVLPKRAVGDPPLSKGPLANVKLDSDRLAYNFFNFLGWDMSTGQPTVGSLRKLGLEEVAKDMYGDIV